MQAPLQPESRAPDPVAARLRDHCADMRRSGCASAGLVTVPESWMREYDLLLSRTGAGESWMACLRARVERERIFDEDFRVAGDVGTLVEMARKSPAKARLLVLDLVEDFREKGGGNGGVVAADQPEEGLVVLEHRGPEPRLLELLADGLASGMAGMRGNPDIRLAELLDYLRIVGGMSLRGRGASGGGRLAEEFVLTKNPRYWRFPVVDLELLAIPAGRFLMGSPEDEAGRGEDERQHWVRLTRAFWMGKHPVTQGQYRELMGTNPSLFTGDDRLPVENVSWDEGKAFCDRLNSASEGRRPEGMAFRLPTEAEWEYCCRGGTEGPFGVGDGKSLSSREANFDGGSPYGGAEKGPHLGRTTVTGSYPANRWGLCDMHGNVWEWCQDWDGDYPKGEVEDPVGSPSGRGRVVRSGSWGDVPVRCRSASRGWEGPDGRRDFIGFRVCLAPGPADHLP